MAEQILYLTELLGLRVFDLKRRVLGRVRDAALMPVVHPVRVDRFLMGAGGYAWMNIRFDQIATISLDGIYLSDEQLTPFHSDDEYVLRLERDLLDQQIIDSEGRKVVRVTDVTFDIRHDHGRDSLHVLEVDVGMRSIFRRLSQGVLPRRIIRQLQRRIPPNSIRWELCNIVEPDPQRRLRLNISMLPLEKMHPADLADIVEELSPEDREAIFEAMDSERAADALSEVDPDIQASILESLEAEKAADILEEMSPDAAADALAELEDETSAEILEEMESAPKSDVRDLMEFDEDTAGGMMNTEYLALSSSAHVKDAVTALRGNQELLETLNTLFLVDAGGRLVGAVPIARLFAAGNDKPLTELALDSAIQVHVDAPEKEVTDLFDKYNLLSLPVTEEDGTLAGVITADDVITVLRQR